MVRTPLDNTIIVVNEEPYCIWEVDLKQRNKEFLDGIDVNYFDYILNAHLSTDDEKRASIVLRATFHHALETMVSLLGAYIQAPDCVYAWIAKCSNPDLRALLQKVNKGNTTVFTKLKIKNVSWKSIAEVIFRSYLPGTEKNRRTTEAFSKLWQRLTYEYLDENHINEYNSLKHGFRVKSGGFGLSVGIEHEYGVSPPENEMQLIGYSEHGTSFFKLENIGDRKRSRNVRSRKVLLNWKIEKIALLIQLISISITNITSALLIANGAKPSTLKFVRPSKDDDFEKPWEYSPGVTSCNLDFSIDESWVTPTTRAELLKKLFEFRRR